VVAYMGMFSHTLKSAEVFCGMCCNIVVVMTFQFLRWWPMIDPSYEFDFCPACDNEMHPYSLLCTINATGGPGKHTADCPAGFEWTFPSRFKPQLQPPVQPGGLPEEQYLWLLPPFWGLITSIPFTWICHFLFRLCPGIQGAFDKFQALPVSVLAKFGSKRMDIDVEGKIVAELLEGVSEPLKQPMAWPFLAFPFCIPWIMLPYYKDPFIPEPVKGGMAEWAYNFTIINSISTGCLMVACGAFWKGRAGEGEGKGFGVSYTGKEGEQTYDDKPVGYGKTEKALENY